MRSRKLWHKYIALVIVGLMGRSASIQAGTGDATSLVSPDRLLAKFFNDPPVNLSAAPKLIWTPVMTGGFGNPSNGLLRGLEEFGGRLYAITSNTDGGEV